MRKRGKKRRWFVIFATCLVGLFIVMEVVLRVCLGFCDALLYQSSDRYEYIAAPNQDHRRFGAHIHYNSHSQRSEEPDTTKTKILGLGDSVIFGGTWMDQDSLATTLFTHETGMQMLNISAGSWGPDNCAAYLDERGTFGAKAMILVCSSHDAYDVMSFFPVVGNFPNYPDHQYSVALWELADRYLLPYLRGIFYKVKTHYDPDAAVIAQIDNAAVAKKSPMFNPGFDRLKAIADSLHIPFAIYLHAEQGELAAKEYNVMGQQIMSWAKESNVPLTDGISSGETPDMYHDAIHLNAKGQRHLADCMERIIETQIGH